MKYKSPVAFKSALLARLKNESEQQKIPFLRVQMRFLFERLLVRAHAAFPKVVVKGGAAMEFRLSLARTTRDLDLGVYNVPGDLVLSRLQESGQEDFQDFITFEIIDDPHHSILEADGMKYQGRRLRVLAKLAGKPLFGSFGVDIAVGEPAGPPDQLTIESLLANAGMPPLELSVYSLESHIAEKLHAYTLPRPHPNSRVKDLPDLALLAAHRPILETDLRQAIESTFSHRNTHPVPRFVPEPSEAWLRPYANIAQENGLPWKDLASLQHAVTSFLDPILESPGARLWNPLDYKWTL